MNTIAINKGIRLEWLDALKGFGIILIMMVHTGMMPRWSILFTAGYVSLFFVAAGFTFTPKGTIGEEVNKKWRRLITPYFFYGVIGVAVTCLVVALEGGEVSFFGRFVGLLYSRYSTAFEIESGLSDIPMLKAARISPMWFLTSLFTSFLAAIILIRVQNKKIQYFLVVMYIVMSMAMTFLPVLLPWSLDTAFVGAILIFWGTKRIHLLDKRWLFVLGAGIYVGLVFIEKTNNISVRQYGWHGFLSIIPYLLIGILETDLLITMLKRYEGTFIIKLLAHIGKFSFVLMCVHASVYTVLRAFGLHSSTWWGGVLFVIIALVVGYLVYYGGNKYVSREYKYIIGL